MNILWDFDGTLFNTYPAYTAVFKEVLGDEGITEEEVMSQLKISFSDAEKHFRMTEGQMKEIRHKIACLSPDAFRPFAGVEEVLKYAQINVIMTHKPREEVLAVLQHFGWDTYFTDMVAGDDGYPRKPDPASYQHLHNQYHIDLVIGDRELDILPGKALGIKTCLFQNECSGADFYMEDYAEFAKIREHFAD
ncbi:HAD-IA family hydrolase [Paenibacillus azoreducens]|uniref:HAD-IA family hydrolase n=1 Tax=Paenibacillus azoreducens TaxID=116718 RepID=UPI0039F50D57